MSRKKVGFYAGTFNPVHEGHLAFCLEAIRVCSLDTVIISPEKLPRGKNNIPDVGKRLAALQNTVANLPVKNGLIKTALLHSDQFTISKTMPEIRGLCGDAEITLLLGSDVAANLIYWDKLNEILGDMHFAIGLRHGSGPEEIDQKMRDINLAHNQPVRYSIITTNYPLLSSTSIRATEGRKD